MNATFAPVAPKFRTTGRLVLWVRRNRLIGRVSRESEACFFKSKEGQDVISQNVVRYSDRVGDLGSEIEALLLDKDVFSYLKCIHRRGVAPKDHLLDRLDASFLVSMAGYSGKLNPTCESRIASEGLLPQYAEAVGVLPPELEERITEPNQIYRYVKVLCNSDKPIPEFLLRGLVGYDTCFTELAHKMKRRLPDYLEESIRDPHVALNYARSILRGRLPEKVEQVLGLNPDVAARYAFEVVRAYANPRLPDYLHNSVMLAGSGSNNQEIKRYLVEVERLSKQSE